MAISIRNRRAESLARELAELQHVSMTQAIIEALEERKAQLERRRVEVVGTEKARLLKIREITRRCASLPERDHRTADDILGYGEDGLPS
ncbi:MAG: type II toxin-antitoxin system VapB family antitoxin [Spirochaetaceae bacterium]